MIAAQKATSSLQRALVIASGRAMLEKIARPLKEEGMSVNACEGFDEARRIYREQSLVILPLREDDRSDLEAFVEWLTESHSNPPYILAVGNCDPRKRQALVNRLGLNDLITLPYSETEVHQRLSSYRRWGRIRAEKVAETPPQEAPADVVRPARQTTRARFFPGADEAVSDEAHEAILIRESPLGIAMLDRDLRYLLANPRWLQQFGLAGKELVGKRQFEVFPDLHPDWRKIYERCLDGDTRRGREGIDAMGGAPAIEMRWEVRPWRFRTGQIGGITIAFEEVWLGGEEEKGPSLVPKKLELPEDLHAPAVIVDLEGRLMKSNPAARRLMATTEARASFDKAFPPDPGSKGHEELNRGLKQFRESGNWLLPLSNIEAFESTGNVARIVWANAPYHDVKGRIIGLYRVGVRLDDDLVIEPETDSEEREAEASEPPVQEAIRSEVVAGPEKEKATVEGEPYLNEVMDARPDLAWKADRRGALVYFNREWRDFRGRSLEQELAGGWLSGLHPDDEKT
ncbi:MAG: PAS domain-containing protein, partial [Verrucomicrobiota bacterium]